MYLIGEPCHHLYLIGEPLHHLNIWLGSPFITYIFDWGALASPIYSIGEPLHNLYIWLGNPCITYIWMGNLCLTYIYVTKEPLHHLRRGHNLLWECFSQEASALSAGPSQTAWTCWSRRPEICVPKKKENVWGPFHRLYIWLRAPCIAFIFDWGTLASLIYIFDWEALASPIYLIGEPLHHLYIW